MTDLLPVTGAGTGGVVDYRAARGELLARPGLSGPGRRAAVAELTDAWVAGLFHAAGAGTLGCALVAVGGYGRGELSPGSDLDLLLLRPPTALIEDVAVAAERLWYPVWDAGVRLDHSVRTPVEARRVAVEDLPALLGLLDIRHLAGDAALTETVRSSVLADWRGFAARRLPELQALGRDRAERCGDLAFALEPDLKESRGGLRDLVALRAVAASWVADAPHPVLESSRAELLDVRDALHRVQLARQQDPSRPGGRLGDRLVQQEQDAVAGELGLLDGDVLLRHVGGIGRAVAYAADTTWHRVEQALTGRQRVVPQGLRRPRRLAARLPLAEGVVEQDGEVVLARDAERAQDPVLALRAAAAAAQAGLRLGAHTAARLSAADVRLPEPWPLAARDALVSLLGAGPAAVPVWEALDQHGLVGRWLPDWERVRSRPQRNPVHRFTVDRHLVETAAQAARLTRRVHRPDLLLVGALLHDIGKGWPGDHSEAGVAVVADLAPRLGFDRADTEVLATLVRHHLLLPDTATRRDLDDPATVEHVASRIRTVEVLDLLHALTVADGLATGPAAWGDWKAGLVEELVARTRAQLRGHEAPAPPELTDDELELAASRALAVRAEPAGEGLLLTVAAPDRLGLLATVAGVLALQRLTVRAASVRTVGDMAVQRWTVQPEFGEPPALDRLREDLRRALSGGLDVAGRLAERQAGAGRSGRPAAPVAPPRVDVVPASAAATVLEVRVHDRPGLLHTVGRVLADQGVDVRSALVSTLGSEVVDVFYVVAPDGDPLSDDRAHQVADALRTALR